MMPVKEVSISLLIYLFPFTININIWIFIFSAFLKEPLEDYVAKLKVPVKVYRSEKRTGLVRARLIGAKEATGKLFLNLVQRNVCILFHDH